MRKTEREINEMERTGEREKKECVTERETETEQNCVYERERERERERDSL